MSLHKCHTPGCENTFESPTRKRRLCDKCRHDRYNALARQYERRRRLKSPAYRKKLNAYRRKWRKKNLEKMRAYNKEWMARKRAGLPTKWRKAKKQPVRIPTSAVTFRDCECRQCGLRMFANETVCERCGQVRQ